MKLVRSWLAGIIFEIIEREECIEVVGRFGVRSLSLLSLMSFVLESIIDTLITQE
jgi:hypothetical protein